MKLIYIIIHLVLFHEVQSQDQQQDTTSTPVSYKLSAFRIEFDSDEEALDKISGLLEEFCSDRAIHYVDKSSMVFNLGNGETYDCQNRPTTTTRSPTTTTTGPPEPNFKMDGTVQVFQKDASSYDEYGTFLRCNFTMNHNGENTTGDCKGGSINLWVNNSIIYNGIIYRMILPALSNSTHRATMNYQPRAQEATGLIPSGVHDGLTGIITKFGNPQYLEYPGPINNTDGTDSFGYINDTRILYYIHDVSVKFYSNCCRFEPIAEVPDCGLVNHLLDDPLRRIVNSDYPGRYVHTVPWYAQLKRLESKPPSGDFWMNLCGGSVISKRLILTSEACVRDPRLGFKLYETSSLKVHLARNLYTRNVEKLIPYSNDEDWERHEDNSFNCTAENPRTHSTISDQLWDVARKNLALILMNEPVELNFFVHRICLPSNEHFVPVTTGSFIFGTGFDMPIDAKSSYNENLDVRYMKTTLFGSPFNSCEHITSNETNLISSSWAMYPNESHVCEKDLGGIWATRLQGKYQKPHFDHKETYPQYHYYQIGIVTGMLSAADNETVNETIKYHNLPGTHHVLNCVTPLKAIGVSILKFIPWIRRHMRNFGDE